MLQIKEIIDGKYEIVEFIGKGGMGRVYKARHISLQNYWAIKEVELASGSEINLLAEPATLRKLNHPNLPRITDVFQMTNCLYIVEDFIEGIALNVVLEEQGAIDEETAINLGKQVCDALIYLHSMKPKPIIYRDLKPNNIMLQNNNIVKLIDFGTTKEGEGGKDKTGYATYGYTPPEQYKGITDKRSDVYAFGALMYALVTGLTPDAKEINKICDEDKEIYMINPKVSKALRLIIKKSMDIKPNKRYQDFVEIKNDLINIDKINKKYTKGSKAIRLISSLIIGCGIVGGGYYFYDIYNQHKTNAYNESIEQCMQLIDSGKSLQAENILKDAINKTPNRNEAYKYLFKIYLSEHRYDDVINGIDDLDKRNVIKLDKEFNYLKGTAFFEQGEYDKAVNEYKLAIDKDSSYKEAKIELSVSLARAGKTSEARSILEELKNADPKNSAIYYLQAEIDVSEKDFNTAVSNINTAIDQKQDDLDYYTLKAQIYRQNNEYEKEVETLKEALKKCPSELINIYILLGDACQRAANNDGNSSYINEAFDYYDKAKTIGVETAALNVKIGRLYRVKKDYVKSEEYFEKAIQIDSNSSDAYIQLGYLYIEKETNKQTKLKDYSQAKQALEKGISLSPNSNEAVQAKAYLQKLKDGE